ncbi:MAG: segregation/condensation protein A [Myxococcales bacterium]
MSSDRGMETPNPLAEEIAPSDQAFRIELPLFEGPLDLLLHLIKKHELEILDLPIAFITERYLAYLKMMQELDLDVAAEYLLMAATLAHIKSKMLLPKEPEDQQEEDELDLEDPRAELIRRLLEYQKYKAAGEELGSRAIAGRDVFPRGAPAPEASGPAPLAEVGLFKLLDAFEKILERAKDRVSLEVTSERISIQERMTEITDFLRERRSCRFEELFEGDLTRYQIVVTFLAMLEMTKMHVLRIYQADHTSPIHLQYALLDADAPTIPPEHTITSDASEAQPFETAADTADETVAQSASEAAGAEGADDDFDDDFDDDDFDDGEDSDDSDDDAAGGDEPAGDDAGDDRTT